MSTPEKIEKIYQKKTPLEHILLRPDTYIGSTEFLKDTLWVYDDKEDKLSYKSIEIVPGLYKIFDEILVNAVDNFYRDKKQKFIKVNINQAKNEISVTNDGKPIPIVMHKEHKCYVPELIFAHLLTSSNYDDSVKKTIGGRNGYGAKLTNIFSTKFIIEIIDLSNKLHYTQEFSNNMKTINPPVIEKLDPNHTHKTSTTKITFYPDMKKFHMKNLDDDIVSLMKKRVYDIAGTTPFSLNIFYNNKQITDIRKFEDYVDLYFKNMFFDEENKIEHPKIFDFPNDRWEVMVTMSDSFQQVSFVNNICTSKGGTHVNYIVNQVTERIQEHIEKKNKNLKIKAAQIKQRLSVFINCKIENPTFDSQTKETMTLKQSSFGSECELSEKFYKQILKSLIIENIVSNVKASEKVKLSKALSSTSKKVSRLLGIPKLEDANNAGTKLSKQCTLILTEGDSAKALAMSGLEVVGRDDFGVFPLRGKLLNVREANQNVLIKNEEIQNIMKIIGLQIGKVYDASSIAGLRYGKLMIMADQDPDGSHIKGLIINFIDHFWPSLIKSNCFLEQFITPLVKVTLPNNNNNNDDVLTFYSTNDFKSFYSKVKETKLPCTVEKLKIKYYKGLGTSTSKEAKEYFKNFHKNSIQFSYKSEQDTECIDNVFSKLKTEFRKEWLSKIDLNSSIDYSKKQLRYLDFINKEFIFFSHLDNARSIPSVVDGLKPSERKILFSCFKRKLVSELKVAQLAGYVAEHSAYHHGEQSLCLTITSMAQDFVGSNNINLLLPLGQFGNRYLMGKNFASARYIFTKLNKITRMIFKESDDNVLSYNVEEGQKIEPEYYVPILPLLLINGTTGIGTGWSTAVPSYNPIDISNNIINRLNDDNYEFQEMKPWFKGFIGEVLKCNDEDEIKAVSNNNKKKVKSSNLDGESSIINNDNNDLALNESINTANNKNNDNNNTSNNFLKPIHNYSSKYSVNGRFKFIPYDLSLVITELPIKTSITQYKEFLETNYIENKDNLKKEFEITDMQQHHSENKIFFKVKLTADSYKKLDSMNYQQQLKTLKLTSTLSTVNMVAFDSNNQIRRYLNTNEILEEFFNIRISYYNNRKKFCLEKLKYQYDIIKNKLIFIENIIKGEIIFANKSKAEIISSILNKGILPESEIKNKYNSVFSVKISNQNEVVVEGEDKEDNEIEIISSKNKKRNPNEASNTKTKNKSKMEIDDEIEISNSNSNSTNKFNQKDFDYLMSMNMWNLTKDKVDSLTEQEKELGKEIKELESTSVKQLWKNDIEEFVNEYQSLLDIVNKSNLNVDVEEFAKNKINKSKNNGIKKDTNGTSKSNNNKDSKNQQNSNITKVNSNKGNINKKNKRKDSFVESSIEDDDSSSSFTENEEENDSINDDENDYVEDKKTTKTKTSKPIEKNIQQTIKSNVKTNNRSINNTNNGIDSSSFKKLTDEELLKLPLMERVKYKKQLADDNNKKINNITLDNFFLGKKTVNPNINNNSKKDNSNIQDTPSKIKTTIKENISNSKPKREATLNRKVIIDSDEE